MEGRLLRVVPLGAAVILLGAALLSVGCGSSSGRYRFIQAATAVPSNVDLQVDGKSVQTAIGFGQTATYHSTGGGSHKFTVFASGTTTNPYASSSISVTSNTTVFTAGLFTNGTIPNVLVFTDDNTVPTTGNARLRIIHMSPSAGNVDVYIVSPPGTALGGLNPQISSLTNANASSYQQLSANSYDVVAAVAGKQIELVRDSYTLTSGQVRTVVLLDNPNGGLPSSQIILNDLN
jgi:hypothetical protein